MAESPNEYELAQMNLELDPRGCFGRIAICFALIERHFADQFQRFAFGEVRKDWFWMNLMHQWTTRYAHAPDSLPSDWIAELLTYEAPHGIVMDASYQYDPLSAMVKGRAVRHPETAPYPPWPALTASLLVSKAILASDPYEKLRLLDSAEATCPNMLLVKQNRLEPLILLERQMDVADLLHVLLSRRPTARAFFLSEALFERKYDECVEIYGDKLWNLIKTELERQMLYES